MDEHGRRKVCRNLEDCSDPELLASFVSLRSCVRKLYGRPFPPAPESMVARFDDITGGFQYLERCEFVSPTLGTQAQRAAAAIRSELMRFELQVKAVQDVG